jgi:hypothetical protein
MMEPKGGEEAMVNVERLNRDLKILLAMFGREGVTWQIDPQRGGFIIIKHLPLPPNVHPRVTGLKVAVPDNLYQRSGKGWVFYKDIWVDPGLKVRYPDGRWGPIPRHHDAPYRGDRDSGWRYLCAYPQSVVDEKVTILDLIRFVQVWFANCLELNRNWF